MSNILYNDAEKDKYIPRMDFKATPDGLLRKEMFPLDTITGLIADVRLTVQDVKFQHNTYNDQSGKETKQQWVLFFKENYQYSMTGEPYKWSVPLALNLTNAKFIQQSTGMSNMMEIKGKTIEISYDKTISIGKKRVGGIRITKVFTATITPTQEAELRKLIIEANKNEKAITTALHIQELSDLPIAKYQHTKDKLIKSTQQQS